MKSRQPPQFFLRLFRWFCHPSLRDSIEGDLFELYNERLQDLGKRCADWRFSWDIILLFRPGIIRPLEGVHTLNQYAMFKSYFVIGSRNLYRNMGYTVINVGGLALGMTVAMLIGLWVYDELSYNKYHNQYSSIVQIMKGGTFKGETYIGQRSLPFPLIDELQSHYQDNFKHIVPAQPGDNILSYGDKHLSKSGMYMGESAPEMLTLKMKSGSWSGLKDPRSIMLSETTAQSLFGNIDPMNKIIQINSTLDVKVTGVYEDLPFNTEFHNLAFLGPWTIYVESNAWLKTAGWENHFLKIYAEISPNKTMALVNDNIREAEMKAIKGIPGLENEMIYHPVILLHPMSDWHLFSIFKKGVQDTGPIQSVRVVGIIGGFVLLLACINFMNLSTARSEKRAKEVGIRKSIGSLRSQLISQFYSESLLMVLLAFVLSIVLMSVTLPLFNDLAGKQISMPWNHGWFWAGSLGFILLTGLLAGSYPAVYLSSFSAHKVLKGTFRVGKYATMPRQILVVLQFTVSVSLIIGTIIIYNQVMFAKNRPVGYTREGVLMVQRKSSDFFSKAEVLRNELRRTGVVTDVSESGGQLTESWSGNGGFSWPGKNAQQEEGFATLSVSAPFGKTVGWQFLHGRDFSEDIVSDSSGFVINESAMRYMNIKEPVGSVVHWKNTAYGVDRDFRILGVIRDMVMESPYEKVEPSIYFLQGWHGWFNIKINPEVSVSDALPQIENVFRKLIPAAPFEYKFADLEYALKFSAEERVGRLAAVFSTLAIAISCLGLFGLASFVAMQRTKEMGIRKVVGATVINLWQLMSRDFVALAALSTLLAVPISWYFLSHWLEQFEYRTEIHVWVFVVVGTGTLLITLATVSFHAIRTALSNPVNSLKME